MVPVRAYLLITGQVIHRLALPHDIIGIIVQVLCYTGLYDEEAPVYPGTGIFGLFFKAIYGAVLFHFYDTETAGGLYGGHGTYFATFLMKFEQ